MSIRTKLTILLVFLFASAIANSFFTFQLETYGEKKLAWVTHTNEVLGLKDKLLGALKDAETGQRGFLLSTDPSYLEPYYAGIVNSKGYYEQLIQLTLDNSSQQKLLKSVHSSMQLKFDELAETIALVQDGNKSAALEIVLLNKGKRYMDDIRASLKSFTNAELILLEQRKGDFRENRAQITTLIAVEVVMFFGLLILTFTFLNRSFFRPLKLLLLSAKKVESGAKLEVLDVFEKDEMGRLLSAFVVMSQKVFHRAENLDRKARHDVLTGLKNRTSLADEIKKGISGTQQSGDKLAVLFLDLNLFKKMNDTLGHEIGDLILKETAARLNSSVRPCDTVFRIGGDEFLVIVRNIKDSSDVDNIVANILKKFETPATIQGQPVTISISIGVAIAPDDTSDPDEIVKFSDIAMYQAKRDNDANYKLFDKSMLRRTSDA